MNLEQWRQIESCAHMEPQESVPVSLIVDSPWIPGYLGLSILDYFSLPDVWLQANLEVEKRFPEIIFLPGLWVEFGMGAEPSGFGCPVSFYPDSTPVVRPLLKSVEQVDGLRTPNPRQDGLMPLILNLYRRLEPRAREAGQVIKVVAARGPLATAAHLLGVTDFLLGLKLDPENTHRLLQITTDVCRIWLEAQAEALSDVEGIMVLDDLMGFLSPNDYMEFAHPYMQQVFGAFPQAVRMLHNDMNNPVCFPHLADLGVQIFNFSHQIEIAKARQLVGPQVCLMGNVPPLETLSQGTVQEVQDWALGVLAAHPDKRGLLLSAGGGVPPGTPGENLQALVAAVHQAAASRQPSGAGRSSS